MGFLLGILNGLATSFQNSQIKSLPKLDSNVINGIRFLSCVPVLGILVTIFDGWHTLPLPFILIVLAQMPTELLVAYFYVRAFQYSPQSLVGPLFSLSVIFLVPVSFFAFDIIPSPLGWAGIITGLLGTFFLGWDLDRKEFRSSLSVIFSERGTYYMLAAAACSVVAVTLIKFSYAYVSPLTDGFYAMSGVAICYLPFVLKSNLQNLKGHLKHLILMGASASAGQTFTYLGLFYLAPAYFISLKRSAILFDVLFGKFVHGETHFKGRLIGALFMISGIILIAFAK